MKFKTLIILSLFSAIGLFAQDSPSASVPTPKGYLLGPGDIVNVTVAGEKEYDFIATIDEDGKLEVPYPENKPITARCMTERDLRLELSQRLEKWFRNPQVNVRTEKHSRPPATIYGEVNNPGRIDMMRKATLLEVIAFSGGLREEAAGLVQVTRNQAPLCSTPDDRDNWKAEGETSGAPSRTFSLAKLKLGDDGSNPTIYPGDVIYVYKAAPVYMTGEVVSAQGIYIKDGGLSLQQAIAKVGGFRREAKTSTVTVYRLKPGSLDEPQQIVVNFDQVRKGLQKDVLLQPYDVVEVGMAKDSFAKATLKALIGAGRNSMSSFGQGFALRILY